MNAEEAETVEAWEALEEAEMVEVAVVYDDNLSFPFFLNCLILFCLTCYGCLCCICYNEEMDRKASLSAD